jgi:hypothetical protein
MPRPIKNDKGIMKEGEYRRITMKATFSPNFYNRIRLIMEKRGITNESSWLEQASAHYATVLEKIIKDDL